METQNVTLSLPRALLKKVKIVAAKRETSVSALLAASREEIVRRDDDYEAAIPRVLARIRKGYNLSTGGRVTVGVELARQLAVGALDLVLGCAGPDAEQLVVIGHGQPSERARPRRRLTTATAARACG